MDLWEVFFKYYRSEEEAYEKSIGDYLVNDTCRELPGGSARCLSRKGGP